MAAVCVLNMEAGTARVIAGTHCLVYDGLDGERYRAAYRHEGDVGFLDVRRIDGEAFRLMGRSARSYRPIMSRREVGEFVYQTVRDERSGPELVQVNA